MTEYKQGKLKENLIDIYHEALSAEDGALSAIQYETHLLNDILNEAKKEFYKNFTITKNWQNKYVIKTSIKHPSNTLAEYFLKWFGEP